VSAIASQSLRNATSIEHGQEAIESRLQALGRAHDLLLQARWSSASLALQLLFLKASESMGNHDSEVVGACSVD
jgi:two-component sensor histidine kinase